MGPWFLADKILQEQGCRNGPAKTTIRTITHVRKRALELASIVLKKGHWPAEIILFTTAFEQHIAEKIVIAKEARDFSAQPNFDCAREGRNIDDGLRPIVTTLFNGNI